MMIFHSFSLSPNGKTIEARAEGHATEVIEAFHEACGIVFKGGGPWRFTQILGQCLDEMNLDSEMSWSLRAERKVNKF